MDFSRRTKPVAELEAHHRANSPRVPGRTSQPHTQPGFASDIVKQPGLTAILGDHQVGSTVPVEIADRGAALLSINFDAALLPGYRSEATLSVPLQQQAAAGIVSRGVRIDREEILAQEDIFIPIAVVIGDADRKTRGKLRFERKDTRLKVVAPVQQGRSFEPVRFGMPHDSTALTHDLLDTRLGPRLVRRESCRQQRYRLGDPLEQAARHVIARVRLEIAF